MRQMRFAGCSSCTASCTISPSYGSTPEWFATIRPGPSEGTCSVPVASTRHHTAYRNCSTGSIVSAKRRSAPNSSVSSECQAK